MLSPPGTVYSVITPELDTRPTLLPGSSLNQSAPSSPVTMSPARLLASGNEYRVTAPSTVMRPMKESESCIAETPAPLNQSAPSGPQVIAYAVSGTGYSSTRLPVRVHLPIYESLTACSSTLQRNPAPNVKLAISPPLHGSGQVVIAPAV